MADIGVPSMGDCLARIEKSGSRWEVEISDPKIVAANKDSDKWQDPWVSFQFDTLEQVMAFLTKALPVAVPKMDPYTTSFDKFAKAASGEREE